MLEKFFKYIGYGFALLLLLFLSVSTWFSQQSSNHRQTGDAFIETAMPIIVKWNIDTLKPLLSPDARNQYDSADGRLKLEKYSKLGKLQLLEPYQFTGAQAIKINKQSYELLNYSMLGHFEAGDGLIIVTIAAAENAYSIHQIIINSNVFSKAN